MNHVSWMATWERFLRIHSQESFLWNSYEIIVLQKLLHYLDAVEHFGVISLLGWPIVLT